MIYKPIFVLNDQVLELFGSMTEMIGQFKAKNILDVNPTLRRENQIKSVTSTCAIEGNTLSESLVSDIIDHKRVLGRPREILEIKNALALYDLKGSLDYTSIQDHLNAHKILMDGLVSKAGQFRTVNVGVVQGATIIHRAPPASKVKDMMKGLFEWIRNKNPTNIVIQSAVFHYEFEFIHPFVDGNGRMGRFWQNLMLIRYHPIFRSVPVESIIHRYQSDYYRAIQASQEIGECSPFVEFSLFTIVEALKKVFAEMDHKDSPLFRLQSFIHAFKGEVFARADYMEFFKGIGTATASNDLREGVEKKLFEKSGDKRTTRYKIMRRMIQTNING